MYFVDISDSMKTGVQVEEQSRLVYCGMGIVSYLLQCLHSMFYVS